MAAPSNIVNKESSCKLFREAWCKSVTPSNVKNSFRACGIIPLNRDAIPVEAYAPSESTNRPLPQPEQQSTSALLPQGQPDCTSTPKGTVTPIHKIIHRIMKDPRSCAHTVWNLQRNVYPDFQTKILIWICSLEL
ncbi:unnamed protein product [Owenia fusiformis]|uniref:Uncharacterized protein n=1 Tax=Owenia fusiformis TaxID=6347 RepID=A0A8S4PGX4_OWEFU|nr:unnamed protein product [Owenia fusiformis]